MECLHPTKLRSRLNKTVRFQDLGRKDYKESWDYQEQLFKEILDTKIKNRREDAGLETDNHLLFVEHDHVYTLGKSGVRFRESVTPHNLQSIM